MNLYKNEQYGKNVAIPGIEYRYDENRNPTVSSPFSPFEIPFYQTRDTLMDVDTYKKFLDNAESRFRKSRTYKQYKGNLINLGMDRCQVHGNITSEMATVEMHHNALTLFDITYILCEHVLNTKGYISTFDLVALLKKVHIENKVQLVMLSLTAHQLYHNTVGMYIHPDMCFGNWMAFLQEYKEGITIDIASKIITYIDESLKMKETQDAELLDLRQNIIDWSEYNERVYS